MLLHRAMSLKEQNLVSILTRLITCGLSWWVNGIASFRALHIFFSFSICRNLHLHLTCPFLVNGFVGTLGAVIQYSASLETYIWCLTRCSQVVHVFSQDHSSQWYLRTQNDILQIAKLSVSEVSERKMKEENGLSVTFYCKRN